MANELFAHSTGQGDRSSWEPLEDHLAAVAARAASFAAAFGAELPARAAGLLHDIGKAGTGFQAYIAGAGPSCDHSTAGAVLACRRYGDRLGKLLAFAIAGHHAGLADGTNGTGSALSRRLKKGVPIDERWLALVPELPATLPSPALRSVEARSGFQCAFWTRMLFSCLVDADRLETERFTAASEGRAVDRDDWPALASLGPKLDELLAAKAAAARPTPVNIERARILAHVRGLASAAPGLFSLTVPTGGGKTLTSLAFALDHARARGLRRVIYVIPFTSIVEQTAAVFREALGEDAVLEHHSAFDPETIAPGSPTDAIEERRNGAERIRLASENWDAPIVVTTAVQLFESLFANRPSRCRKLHNLARAVIVLDEAQTLPLPLLQPCVAALDELARNYGSSLILCTATQPALKAPQLPGGLEDVRELAPPGLDRLPAFRRVRVEQAPQPLGDADLATALLAEQQVLCVVNPRAQARAVFDLIAQAGDAFHLSTLMYARHRSAALATIRQRLKEGRPTRVVSTSLIEAGVDISFPIVFRAEAGLDQIAQAAGRCNREGELAEGSVIVFASAEKKALNEIEQRAAAARAVLRQGLDLLSNDAVAAFFRELYRIKGPNSLDQHQILEDFEEAASRFDFPFAKVAAAFRMIEDTFVPIIIPRDDAAKEALRDLEHVTRPGRVARRLQPYTAAVTRKARGALLACGAARLVREADFGDQFVVLANLDLYREDVGLTSDDPTFVRAEALAF